MAAVVNDLIEYFIEDEEADSSLMLCLCLLLDILQGWGMS